jgi:hypothetical protein
MTTQHFPSGWDEERIRRVLAHYETQTEEAGEKPAGLLKGNCTMDTTLTIKPVQYLVEEDGQRVGVVLRWEDYQELCATHPADPDLLVSLSDAELQALADSVLVPRQQERLSDLLQRNRDKGLSADEERELDRLLEHVDQMNVLKARAMYALQQRQKTSEPQ